MTSWGVRCEVFTLSELIISHWRWGWVRAQQDWPWQISSTAGWARLVNITWSLTITVTILRRARRSITIILGSRRLRASVARNSLLVTSGGERQSQANRSAGRSPPSGRLSTTSWTSRSLSSEPYYLPDLAAGDLMKAWEPLRGARILQMGGQTGSSSAPRIIISVPPYLTPSGRRWRSSAPCQVAPQPHQHSSHLPEKEHRLVWPWWDNKWGRGDQKMLNK